MVKCNTIYVISSYNYEYSHHYLLKHKESYSDVEFKKICVEAKKKAYKKLDDEIREFERTHWKTSRSVDDDHLVDEMHKVLIKEYGFEEYNTYEFDVYDNNIRKSYMI